MDATTLATSVVTMLSPLLMKAGEKAIEKVGEKLPEAAGKLWEEVRQKIGRKEAAREAMTDFAAKPDDADNAASFRKELRKVFELDSKFAKDLEKMLDVAKAQLGDSITNTGSGAVATRGGVAAGAGGIAIGGDVQGSIVMGNNNTISNQSGGVNITDSDVKVEGDLVGRDKKNEQ
ncbi:MAG: hypothetical protein HZC38_02345 [Chloroflexi bacterium]|nr:hypothetical protein [Chloroflexota bacterium]